MRPATMLGLLVLLSAPPALSQEAAPAPAAAKPGRLLLFGLRAGPTTPQLFNALRTNFLVNVEAAWAPEPTGFALFVDGGYTRPVARGSSTDARLLVNGGQVSYAMTVQDVAFGLGALYRFSLGGFTPFLGAGTRAHLTKTTLEQKSGDTDLGTNFERNTRIGLFARLGISRALGPGELGVEASFDFTPVDHLITGDKNTAFLGYQLAYLLAL